MKRRRIYFIKKGFQAMFILGFFLLIVLEFLGIGTLLYFLLDNRLSAAIYMGHIKVKTTGELIKPVLINVNTAVALTVVLTAIILALIIIRRVEHSLNIFREAAKRVRNGDLTYRIDYQSHGLTGELIRFFNKMVGRIKEEVDALKSDLDGVEEEIRDLNQRLREGTLTKDNLQENLRSISRAIDKFEADLRRFKV